MWTSDQTEYPIPVFSPPFAVIIISTFFGRLSTKFWNLAIGIFALSALGVLMMSDTDNGR